MRWIHIVLSSWPGLWVCDLAKTGSSLWKAGEAVLDIMFFFFFPEVGVALI